jgi:hypothetical protein
MRDLLDQKKLRAAAILIGGLVAAYLVSPIVSPVHPEGFSAMVESLALHLSHDRLANGDLLQPLNVDYFGLTKLGWLLLTASLVEVLHLSGNSAFGVIHWLSAAVFATGTAFLVRRWTRVPWPLAAASLLLFPGVVETTFFFNDNVVASAFVVAALASLYWRRQWLGSLLCGLLFGCAVLTRTDTLLVGAGVPLIVLERSGVSRTTFLNLLYASVAGALVWFGTLAAFHTSILDVLAVASAAVSAWSRDPMAIQSLGVLTYFMGPLGAILAGCGLLPLIEKRDWRPAARTVVVPLIYVGILWSSLWEVRQLLPLTPFLLALAITGVKGIFDVGKQSRVVLPGIAMAALAFWLLSPPIGYAIADGPRVFSGRIQNVAQWRSWQRDVDKDFDLLDGLARLPAGITRRAVIADSWNEDRYLHLQLLEAGYSLIPDASSQCSDIAEVFNRAGSQVALIRAQQGYVPYWRQLSAERLARLGLPCLARFQPQDLFFVANRERFEAITRPELLRRNYAKEPRFEPLVSARIANHDPRALIADFNANGSRVAAKGEPRGSWEEATAATRKRSKLGD